MEPSIRPVEFVFCRVNQKPRSADDLNRNAWLVDQRRQIRSWAHANGYEIATTVVSTTTSAKPAFAKSADFRRAIHSALSPGSCLVIANLREMLARTDPLKIPECVAILDAAPVNVWDASRNEIWALMPLNARQDLMLKAIAIRTSRSRSILAGLSRRTSSPKAPSTSGKQRGALGNRREADAAARRLADFVKAEIESLGSGAVLSPSHLAKALNHAGIPPARSTTWEHNSAKNLIERLRTLGLI
ncbi:MAG: hypothetical protein E5X65_20705 [Mesorhizobium sp.]|nr:MAG: hypothetical protein E5X65_20705 [Mesorhizobium sp.]